MVCVCACVRACVCVHVCMCVVLSKLWESSKHVNPPISPSLRRPFAH